nr:hypothetical protein [Ferrimicrobium acidiphilum]
MTDHVGVPMIPDSVNVVVQVVEWVKVIACVEPAGAEPEDGDGV